jgi:hypothetical protein
MRSLLYAGLALLLLTASCRKQPNFYDLSNNFVVATNMDTTADFSDYHTYYVSDTVGLIYADDDDSTMYNDNTKKLVAAIKQNMAARGYKLVGIGTHPELGINVGIARDVNIGVVYPGWWTPYYYWWDWYYPYYYPWTTAYVVTTGTIVVDMFDLQHANEKQQYRVLWTANMGGALGEDGNDLQRGIDAINQAFVQSPTIKTE